MRTSKKNLPIVYSCSGCSSAAQMANYIALQLDKRHVAEMSCIAGVGGDVPSLLKLAHSKRPIIAIDGCPIACSRQCLARHDLKADTYLQLSHYGVKKRFHMEFDHGQAEKVVRLMISEMERQKTAPENAVGA